MKKLYLGVVFFLCFFIFSLEFKAYETSNGLQLIIDNSSYNYLDKDGFTHHKMYGDYLLAYSYGSNEPAVYSSVSAVRDYYYYYHSDKIPSDSIYLEYKSDFEYMQEVGLSLYSTLENLLPDDVVKTDYYTIGYRYNGRQCNFYNSSSGNCRPKGIVLYLTYYDEPLVYKDLSNGLGVWGYEGAFDSTTSHNTKVYIFVLKDKVFSYNGVYSFLWAKDIGKIPNAYYKDDKGYYRISNSFYNYFYMSSFSLFPDTENIAFNPFTQVIIYDDVLEGLEYQLTDKGSASYLHLDYFNKYSFSGGSLGIQSLYNVFNYNKVNQPPYNGQYLQFLMNYKKNSIINLEPNVNISTIYFNGSIIVTYTENNEPTTKKEVFALSCPRIEVGISNLCKFDLDFTGLENPGVNFIYDEKKLVDIYKFDMPEPPVVWYKKEHFKLFTSSVNDWNDYTCFNCEPDENGNLPNKVIDRNKLDNFLDSVDIVQLDKINDVSSISGLFSSAFNGAKSILNSGLEILSLVTSFFNLLSPPVKAILLLIFLTSIIAVFIRNIM